MKPVQHSAANLMMCNVRKIMIGNGFAVHTYEVQLLAVVSRKVGVSVSATERMHECRRESDRVTA